MKTEAFSSSSYHDSWWYHRGESHSITLETGYKKAGYKNKSLIRLLFPRTKACNLSTLWIAYKNKSHIRPFFSGTKGLLISGFQCNFYASNTTYFFLILKGDSRHHPEYDSMALCHNSRPAVLQIDIVSSRSASTVVLKCVIMGKTTVIGWLGVSHEV